ncbi:MAG: SixA phosphatase family protein [Saprospiraceae bacterium]|jgi:phosphohistidine phosphatase
MKSLYLIRHAKSSKDDPSLRDFDRPLNEKGHDDAAYMAAYMKFHHVQPDLIISSPAKRAISTCEYFATALNYPLDKIQHEMAVYDASATDLYDVIHAIDNQYQTVLIFGHNPSVSIFTDGYTPELTNILPTCSIVSFVSKSPADWKKFNPDHAKFANLWSPKDFA